MLQALEWMEIFLSTPSARRATGGTAYDLAKLVISIHALREEGDAGSSAKRWTPPNFYPRPPRGGRPPTRLSPWLSRPISIHALREEGDRQG